YETIDQVAKNMRANPRPVIIEALTFRMRGHEEASGTKYVLEELFKEWAKKDPVLNYEKWLVKEGILDQKKAEKTRSTLTKALQAAIEKGLKAPDVKVATTTEINDVYAPFDAAPVTPKN